MAEHTPMFHRINQRLCLSKGLVLAA